MRLGPCRWSVQGSARRPRGALAERIDGAGSRLAAAGGGRRLAERRKSLFCFEMASEQIEDFGTWGTPRFFGFLLSRSDRCTRIIFFMLFGFTSRRGHFHVAI